MTQNALVSTERVADVAPLPNLIAPPTLPATQLPEYGFPSSLAWLPFPDASGMYSTLGSSHVQCASSPFSQSTSAGVYATNDPVLKQALTFIEANVQHSISIEDVANAVRGKPSVRTLQRRFVQTFGATLVDTIQRTRVDRVKSLLGVSTLSMKEIAVLTGFANPSHMSATFRKYEKTTPGEFRGKILSPSR